MYVSYHFGVLESNDALLNDFEPFYEEKKKVYKRKTSTTLVRSLVQYRVHA